MPPRAPFDTWRLALAGTGCGVCVDGRHVVAATAAGRAFEVTPVVEGSPALTAAAVATGAEVVVARLDGPVPGTVRPAPLARWDRRRLRVRVPDAHGSYTRGTVIPDDLGRPRLDLDTPPPQGLAGAGVATADPAGHVIGVVVTPGGFPGMVPIEAVAAIWRPLAALLSHDPRPVRADAHALSMMPSFAAVPAMAEPAARERIVAALRTDISRSADRNPQANFDILGILRACLRFPGGLAELVEVIRLFEQGSSEMAALDRLMADIPPGTVR
ncbi:hypothetical protein [Dactylosporangium sp. NPDC005555]|uniref:effector-associated domain 2-containing protein n=1 Tax=Dactylosporangium sp. NPDC005555 TaxID=3154889 RepID=UPI0033A62685